MKQTIARPLPIRIPNHNQTLVRSRLAFNHNQTLVRHLGKITVNHNQVIVGR
jgi:hypothetical protein